MAGLLIQLDLSVSGIDLPAIVGGVSNAFSELGKQINAWQDGAPGEFGAALSGLGGLPIPQLSVSLDLSVSFNRLLPDLEHELGSFAQRLETDIATLAAYFDPDRIDGVSLQSAFAPLVARIERLQTLFSSDWHCGLAPAPPVRLEEDDDDNETSSAPSSPEPNVAVSTLSEAQVAAARALIDTLPAELSVPTLLRWIHARVGTFRPAYFQLRSLPILDDLRDPLDTLIRWDDADTAAVHNELQTTLAELGTLLATQTHGHLERIRSAASPSALPGAALGDHARSFIDALATLATTVQTGTAAAIDSALAAAQNALTPLATASLAILADEAVHQQAHLQAALRELRGELDAGICRSLLLLRPRASFATLTSALPELAVPSLPAEAFAPVAALIDEAHQRLLTILDLLDISALSAPVTALLDEISATVTSIEHELAGLGSSAERIFNQARSQLQTLNLATLGEQVEAELAQAVATLETALTSSLSPATSALGTALQAADAAMDAIDPETLTAPLQQILEPLGTLAQQDEIADLIALLEQIRQLAASLPQVSFAPAADEVIKAIGELTNILRSIDPSQLPAPGPELIRTAMRVLPQSLVPLTDSLIHSLETQLDDNPVKLLLQIKALPDEARSRLLALSPRSALQPLLVAPFDTVRDGLTTFNPAQWLEQADQALAEARQRLRAQLDIGLALQPVTQAYSTLIEELERLRPSTLLQPLTDTVQAAVPNITAALPADELAPALENVLAAARDFVNTLTAALDVADHLVARLESLGDAEIELESWLEQILAKIPETASGALAAALDNLHATALAASADALHTRWDELRAELAAQLPTGAHALHGELALVRNRIRNGLQALPATTAAELADFLDAPATRVVEQGLSACAALERQMTEAGDELELFFAQLAARFSTPDGPFAELLPDRPASVRQWVRNAIMGQFGDAMVLFLDSLKPLVALLQTASVSLRELAAAVHSKLDTLLAAPRALANLLAHIEALNNRIAELDPTQYTRQLDTLYAELITQLRTLDPAHLGQDLEATRDRLLSQLSLNTLLPSGLGSELDDLHQQLLLKAGTLDPDLLLLQPLDDSWRATVEPLVAALDLSTSIELVIDWIQQLPPELKVQIDRVDQAYRALLDSAPSGDGASISARVNISV